MAKLSRAARLLPLVLLLWLLLTTTALAGVLGDPLDGYLTEAGGELSLGRNVFWTGGDYRTENYLEYSPNSSSVPVVVYGSKLLNYGDFPSMAALLEQQGYTVLGGINGDYYNTANYQPLGIVITEGVLRSSDGGYWAVGFTADGETRIDKPALTMTITCDGATYPLAAVNKARGSSGLVLFTEDHSYTTQAKTPGVNVVLRVPRNEALTVDCRLDLEVEAVLETAEPLELAEGQMILSLADSGDAAQRSALLSLAPGDTLRVEIACAADWQDIEYAVGSMRKLVTDGAVESGLDNSAEPRTAVGVKANGDLVLYTLDGRRSGHSVGASMPQVAERLIELGCVEAAVMDGGGSTTLNAMYLGDGVVSQINRPSGSSQRSVTNYIMLVTKEQAGGRAARLALTPLSLRILSGASAQFTAKAANSSGLAAAAPDDVSYSVDAALGSIDDNGLFHAAGSGSGLVTARADGLDAASVAVEVVAQPDQIDILNAADGSAVTALEAPAGGTLDLSARASYRHLQLVAEDACFTWNVLGDIGSVDDSGLFTAGTGRGEGVVTASAGGVSASVAITVVRAGSFDDVTRADWYYDAVEHVAGKGLFTGTAEYTFSPQAAMNRGMLVTVLHRLAGLPAGAGSFPDVAADAWYAAAVAWAADSAIVSGYDATRFAPFDAVTREQIAVILYRYAGWQGQDTGATAELSGYADAARISDWALPAMQWAVSSGLISGRGNGMLDPTGQATRAEVAAILMRFDAQR